jgi:serine/threonine protein kinase
VCHRDIKPANIYVAKDLESLKIIDFNVALRFKPEEGK